jgi:hypothetical protein
MEDVMFWDVLYSTGAIIFSSLGGGAIVLALSTIIGKYWANRILEKDRARYQQETQESLQLLRDRIERAQFVHRVQFEVEFKVYRELWDKVVRVKSDALSLRPIVDIRPKDKTPEMVFKERFDALNESFKQFKECYICNKPFFAQPIYEIASKLDRVIWDEGFEFAHKDDMELAGRDAYKNAMKNAELIEQYSENICEAIRNRISVLNTIP